MLLFSSLMSVCVESRTSPPLFSCGACWPACCCMDAPRAFPWGLIPAICRSSGTTGRVTKRVVNKRVGASQKKKKKLHLKSPSKRRLLTLHQPFVDGVTCLTARTHLVVGVKNMCWLRLKMTVLLWKGKNKSPEEPRLSVHFGICATQDNKDRNCRSSVFCGLWLQNSSKDDQSLTCEPVLILSSSHL